MNLLALRERIENFAIQATEKAQKFDLNV